MNRTALFLAAAAALALIALVAGLPRPTGTVVVTPPPVGLDTPPATAGDGSIKMSARLSHPYVGVGQSQVFVTVDLNGVDVPGATRSPVNLSLVMDRSGSMGGYKLQQAKEAARQLVMQLKPTDRLAIVHFGGDVKSLDGMFCTETNKEKMLRFIDNIWDEGGTNIGAGLTAGRDLLMASAGDFKVNRIIFMSDGQPTEGIQDSGGLLEVTREIRAHGISVTSIGLGTDFNEDLMQSISRTGSGAYAYLNDAAQLTTIFQRDLTQAATQVAHGVSLTFTLPAGMQLDEVLGYDIAYRDPNHVTLNLPDFSAGQVERLVAKVTVNAPGANEAFDVTALKLDYMDLLKGSQVSSATKLAAMTTDRADLVFARRDKEATVFAARAMSASNTRAAADALKQGGRAHANQLLQQNAYFFEEAAKVAGEGAVAADQAELKSWENTFNGAKSDEEVQAASKGAKRKASIDYGLRSSTY